MGSETQGIKALGEWPWTAGKLPEKNWVAIRITSAFKSDMREWEIGGERGGMPFMLTWTV